MMKTKMMLIMVALCLLFALHEETSVEAGKAKALKDIFMRTRKCCKKIKCFIPDTCHADISSPKGCWCIKQKKEQ